jgi:putative oxidoreductase
MDVPCGFSSDKLRAVTKGRPQFGPPGYETDLLYSAVLATLVFGGSGPFALDQLLNQNSRNARRRKDEWTDDYGRSSV